MTEEQLRRMELLYKVLAQKKDREAVDKMNELELKRLELTVLNTKISMRPHMMYGARVVYDKNEKTYRCELPVFRVASDYEDDTEDDFGPFSEFSEDGIVAYGDTPAAACDNFDTLWVQGNKK